MLIPASIMTAICFYMIISYALKGDIGMVILWNFICSMINQDS